MDKIGLLTYHSAYNFGSVLQAYATQKKINELGYDCEIINYRTKRQRKFYGLFNCFNIKLTLASFISLFSLKSRIDRKNKYENFINTRFILSDCYEKPEDVLNNYNKYDALISGSDQILNMHSNELENMDLKYMFPYLLKDYEGKKISYATSISNMTYDELSQIQTFLEKFDYISIRESGSKNVLSSLLPNQKIFDVLDPTFLLTKDEWVKDMGLIADNSGKYILYYTVSYSIKEFFYIKNHILPYAKKNGCKLKVVTPLITFPFINKNIECCYNYGPIDFLQALYNAKLIVTSSYHGTILSINFNKQFICLCKDKGSEFRKNDILEKIGLSDRILCNISNISNFNNYDIDYESVNLKVEQLRNSSMDYLIRALRD